MSRKALFALAPLALLTLMACVPDRPVSIEEFEAERRAQGLALATACATAQCARLNLDSKLLQDYAKLSAMPHIRALMISYTDFSDLSDIAGLTGLDELHIGATRVRTLSGLAAFPGLKLLHAQQVDVQDYTPILKLTHLRELVIGQSYFDDLTLLRNMRDLRILDISGSDVTDLSPLRNHRNLEVLELLDTDIIDLSPLMALPQLRKVTIDGYGFSPQLQAQIDALRAKGVTVEAIEAIIVC